MAAESVLEYAEEARQEMEEISFALKKWRPHEDSPSTAECALVDLTTMEGRDYTVQLDRRGFQARGASCCVWTRVDGMRVLCCVKCCRACWSLATHNKAGVGLMELHYSD